MSIPFTYYYYSASPRCDKSFFVIKKKKKIASDASFLHDYTDTITIRWARKKLLRIVLNHRLIHPHPGKTSLGHSKKKKNLLINV